MWLRCAGRPAEHERVGWLSWRPAADDYFGRGTTTPCGEWRMHTTMNDGWEAVVGRRVRKEIASRAMAAAPDLLKAVRPIIFYDERECPHIEGSCVLLQIGKYRFLLTAAHVLDSRHQLYVAGEKEAFSLQGPKYSTNPPASKSRSEDKLDVAIIELAAEYDTALGNVRFLTVVDLDVDEQPMLGPSVKSKYLVLGYPATGLKRDLKRRVIVPEPFIYTANPRSDAEYRDLGLTIPSHLVVEFNRRRVLGTEGQRTARKPQGISGGGIWRFDSLLGDEAAANRLVALNIEWLAGARRVLWGTRVAVALEMIRARYPHLSSLIPRSRVLKVNVR